MIPIAASFARALAVCEAPELTSWDDIDAFRRQFKERVDRCDDKRATAGLRIAARQLVHERRIAGRIRHRERAVCASCGRTKRIENVRKMLCPDCVGAASARVRLEKASTRFTFEDGAKQEIFDALVAYERRQPTIVTSAMLRVWALGSVLTTLPSVPQLRSWKEVLALRRAVQNDTMRGRRHKALWALYKVCTILIERRILDPRIPTTVGPLPDQMRAIMTYFYVDDPVRRELLQKLISYFSKTRLTITAVQTAMAMAYYLARTPIGPIRSWADIDVLYDAAPQPPARWSRRIRTALRRLGDALESEGAIAPRPDTDVVQSAVARLEPPSGDVFDINARFIRSLHAHYRRPITLMLYGYMLNAFWQWALKHGITHPAQVSADSFRDHLRTLRRSHWNVDAIERHQNHARLYFEWLRRERLVLIQPVTDRSRVGPTVVRICEEEMVDRLIAALPGEALRPREALIVYLLIFNALRNFEIVQMQPLGFTGRGRAETFDVRLPDPVERAVNRRARQERIVRLPVGRYDWLRRIVVDVMEDRAGLLKRPDNPYLLVSESWRQGTRPMHGHVVVRVVRRATEQVCGMSMPPRLLRPTAGAYFADISDHTICCAMGWSPDRAVELAYATREIVTHGSEGSNTCSPQVLPAPRCTGRKR
jgi:site-specific recombinase XerD